jgi:hypothetical protein
LNKVEKKFIKFTILFKKHTMYQSSLLTPGVIKENKNKKKVGARDAPVFFSLEIRGEIRDEVVVFTGDVQLCVVPL